MSRQNTASAKRKRRISNTAVHVLLAVLAILWVLPILWIILLGFRGESGQYISSVIPKSFTLANYRKLFTDTQILNFPRMFMNTLIISVFSCIISSFFVLAVSYCMSRMRFRMRRPMLNIALILGMFPGFMSMIAIYYILKSLGLSEGPMIRVALVCVYSGGAGLGFYMAKGFFDTIPRSIDEAAYIDGAARWQVFTRITVPLSKPVIICTILQAFMSPWLDFIFARVICRANTQYYTVAIGLWSMLEKEYVNDWFNSFAAGAVLISVPIVILFLSMQRYYQEGVSGAVKG